MTEPLAAPIDHWTTTEMKLDTKKPFDILSETHGSIESGRSSGSRYLFSQNTSGKKAVTKISVGVRRKLIKVAGRLN